MSNRRRIAAPLLALTLLALSAVPASAKSDAADATPGWWTKIATPVGPDPRFEHSMVAAPEFGLVIAFGGLTTHGVDSDVWMIRPNEPNARWFTPTLLWPETPGPRQNASAVWDSKQHRMIVFGGYNPAFNGTPRADGPDRGYLLPRDGYNDVWALEFTPSGTPVRWRQLVGAFTSFHAYGVTEPVERWAAGAIYDAERERLIVHGGVNRQMNSIDDVNKRPCVGACVPETPVHPAVQPYGLPDTWAFDLAGTEGWTLLDADGPKQTQFYAVYDGQRDRMVTVRQYGVIINFSGSEPPSPPPPADLRSFDLNTNQWTDWPDPPQAPGPGLSGAYGFVDATRTVVALGWEWTPYPTMKAAAFALHLDEPGSAATRWEKLPGSPSDPSWNGKGVSPNDPVSPSTWGYIIRGAVLADAEGNGGFVAFGGEFGSTNVFYGPTDLPYYDLKAHEWSVLSREPVLPRYRHAAVLDEARRHMYVLGGHVAGLAPDRQPPMWRLQVDTGTWEAVHPEGDAPPELHVDSVAAMVLYDQVGDRILQMPVRQQDGVYTCGGQVFALDLEELEWSILSTQGQAPQVCEGAFVYDSKRRRALVLNGYTWSPVNFQQTRNRAVYALDLTSSPAAWSQVAVTGSEQGVLDRETSAVYDPIGDRALIINNTAGNWANPQGTLLVESLGFGPGGDGTWSVLAQGGQKGIEGTLTVGPRPRSGSHVVFQRERNRLVIWGGRIDFSGNPPGDPFAYALTLSAQPAWQELGSLGDVPAGRVDSSAVFDAARQRMIVHAGFHRSQNNPTRGTYALDLTA